MKKFPFYLQPDQMDCGPTCLRMIAKHYGKSFSLQRLREISGINCEVVLYATQKKGQQGWRKVMPNYKRWTVGVKTVLLNYNVKNREGNLYSQAIRL